VSRRFDIDSLIGEYRVTRFLGEGGMGVVYLGMHEKLGRPAAIKVLGSVANDESFRTRFFNEARLQANLHHPHIATLYDFQQQGDELLIFMEYVDGESLDALVSRRAFAVDDALSVFKAICEAVSYIHSHGIFHRDIKAQNVKLRADGTVKLLDFGIAKEEASHGLTQTGGIVGTPNYLSPEQLRGEKASPQTDIWALGVLLYEMLTGRLPFEGDSLGGLVLKITSEAFEPADRLNPAVPKDVSKIIAKCLEKDPGHRYRSASELLSAVNAAIDRRNRPQESLAQTLARTIAASRSATPAEAPRYSSGSDHSLEPGATRSGGLPIGIIAAVGGVAVILLILIAGGAFWAMSGDSNGVVPNVSAKTSNSANSVKSSPAVNTQRVRIDVDEGKAQVVRDGQVLGTTPLDIDVAAGDKPNVTLRRDGFEDKTVQVEPTSGKKVFTYSLKAKN
jgi:serine/threonine protein kinase